MSLIKVVSLYTGAGGLDYGFEAAGYSLCVGLEIDSDSCKTISSNRQIPIINKDISRVSVNEILNTANLTRGDVDVLIGGPPCQPFSKSAYWATGDTKRLKDPRANTLEEYMRIVAELLPRVFVLENVHGINYSGKEEGFDLINTLLEDINRKHSTKYRLVWQILNAADYGVAQARKRFFAVAHREGNEFIFPPITHTSLTKDISGHLKPYTTAWDAIGELIKRNRNEDLRVRGKWADLLPSIPEGENYLWHTSRKSGLNLFGWRTRYWTFLLKLAKNQPSWTIQAQPGPSTGPFHWENRLLSIDELARLQTFPDDIIFTGSRISVVRQIGNAVPSLLSEIIARSIAEQFFGMTYSYEPKYTIQYRRPIPSAEPIQKVPEKYYFMIGDHAEHPGSRKTPNNEIQPSLFT